jgi:hypothetical protein
MKWPSERAARFANRLLGWAFLVACWLMLLHFREFDWEESLKLVRIMF